MTLPLQDTLGSVREYVLNRCGMAESAAHNANLQRIVDEFIRDAHSYYYLHAEWFGTNKRAAIPLVDSEQEYDWPDDSEPGTIFEVYVTGVTSERPYALKPMPDEMERYGATVHVQDGRPRFYEYMDGIIRLFPAPDTSRYDSLYMTYRQREPRLVNSSDRLIADTDLVKQRACIDMMIYLGQPGVERREKRLKEMETLVLSHQSNSRSIGLADYDESVLYGTRYHQPWRDSYWFRAR